MKIPTWFIIGCGLLVLNMILVIGGSLSRHAIAEPPHELLTSTEQEPGSEPPTLPDTNSLPPPSSDGPIDTLPTVPSLESASPALPNIVSIQEIENAVGELKPAADLLSPLDAMINDAPTNAAVSEQLSHSYFECMKLRLKTVNNLNQSAMGLVNEAAILYQRGEVTEAQKLLGLATQLRESTARLLVTHQ